MWLRSDLLYVKRGFFILLRTSFHVDSTSTKSALRQKIHNNHSFQLLLLVHHKLKINRNTAKTNKTNQNGIRTDTTSYNYTINIIRLPVLKISNNALQLTLVLIFGIRNTPLNTCTTYIFQVISHNSLYVLFPSILPKVTSFYT